MRRSLFIIFGCVLYVVSPIDFCPDFIPLLGQCDDIAAILISLRALMKGGK